MSSMNPGYHLLAAVFRLLLDHSYALFQVGVRYQMAFSDRAQGIDGVTMRLPGNRTCGPLGRWFSHNVRPGVSPNVTS